MGTELDAPKPVRGCQWEMRPEFHFCRKVVEHSFEHKSNSLPRANHSPLPQVNENRFVTCLEDGHRISPPSTRRKVLEAGTMTFGLKRAALQEESPRTIILQRQD